MTIKSASDGSFLERPSGCEIILTLSLIPKSASHEYKRQQIDALYVILILLDIKAGNISYPSITVLFGGDNLFTTPLQEYHRPVFACNSVLPETDQQTPLAVLMLKTLACCLRQSNDGCRQISSSKHQV